MKKVLQVLPHICIILSGMLLTFFIIDQINPAMAFINNEITKWLIGVTAVLSIMNCIVLTVCLQKKKRNSSRDV